MQITHTEFTTAQGFRFTNAFSLTLGGIARDALVYGLCGGMCFAALDYHYAGRPIPPLAEVPPTSSPLYRFLLRRQIDSLSQPSVLPRLALWMMARNERVAAWTVGVELPRIFSALDHGQPVVLLVLRDTPHDDEDIRLYLRRRGPASPFINHQVVATGYGRSDDGGFIITLYDPNYPGIEPTLSVTESYIPSEGLDRGRWEGTTRLLQSTGEPVRGFFAQAHRPIQVPGTGADDGA
jgi:hypothetical protein